MLAKYIENKKQLMAALLTRDTFDGFELVSGSVTTYAVFSVDGQWHKSFYQDDPDQAEEEFDFSPWERIRRFFLSVIRGKNTPLAFQFTFRLPAAETEEFMRDEAVPEDPAGTPGLLLNLAFDGTSLLLTTGISRRTFSMDRTLERAWDRYVEQRFSDYLE